MALCPGASPTIESRSSARSLVGSLVTDVLRGLGVTPDAAIGYSLGESAALVALRAWANRDEMHGRLRSSPLFESELAGPCRCRPPGLGNPARRAGGLGRRDRAAFGG